MYINCFCLEADLHNVIRKGNILKDTHKRYVMYQLLKAMKYLHSANVIHRDMKVRHIVIWHMSDLDHLAVECSHQSTMSRENL
jgi:serine/threonine protein kinase